MYGQPPSPALGAVSAGSSLPPLHQRPSIVPPPRGTFIPPLPRAVTGEGSALGAVPPGTAAAAAAAGAPAPASGLPPVLGYPSVLHPAPYGPPLPGATTRPAAFEPASSSSAPAAPLVPPVPGQPALGAVAAPGAPGVRTSPPRPHVFLASDPSLLTPVAALGAAPSGAASAGYPLAADTAAPGAPAPPLLHPSAAPALGALPSAHPPRPENFNGGISSSGGNGPAPPALPLGAPSAGYGYGYAAPPPAAPGAAAGAADTDPAAALAAAMRTGYSLPAHADPVPGAAVPPVLGLPQGYLQGPPAADGAGGRAEPPAGAHMSGIGALQQQMGIDGPGQGGAALAPHSMRRGPQHPGSATAWGADSDAQHPQATGLNRRGGTGVPLTTGPGVPVRSGAGRMETVAERQQR